MWQGLQGRPGLDFERQQCLQWKTIPEQRICAKNNSKKIKKSRVDDPSVVFPGGCVWKRCEIWCHRIRVQSSDKSIESDSRWRHDAAWWCIRCTLGDATITNDRCFYLVEMDGRGLISVWMKDAYFRTIRKLSERWIVHSCGGWGMLFIGSKCLKDDVFSLQAKSYTNKNFGIHKELRATFKLKWRVKYWIHSVIFFFFQQQIVVSILEQFFKRTNNTHVLNAFMTYCKISLELSLNKWLQANA